MLEKRGLAERLHDRLQSWRGRERVWCVRVTAGPWYDTDFSAAIGVPNPPGRYFADPFVVGHEGTSFLFVEDYCRERGRGAIAVLALGEEPPRLLGNALTEAFHLSFPFIFAFEGTLFMAPECHEAGEIRIYRCVEFPLDWRLERVAIPGLTAVDPLIFEHDGRWWLMCTTRAPGADDLNGAQLIFSAFSPLGEWKPHIGNPFLTGPQRARNGGLLRRGERLYRVGQRQGLDVYGRGLGVYRIAELSDTAYREKLVGRIGPRDVPGARAVHHLHSDGRFTAFDYSRYV